jgi:hypothetical protein
MEYQEKFIAYVDVMGFKKLVEDSEKGTGMPLSELMELLRAFGSSDDIVKLHRDGPITCPASKYIQRDLNFKITQISDCAVISSEISPAGVINLVRYCWGIVLKLLQKGILCRGYITKGLIYHTESQCIGSGYMDAYDKEKKITVFKRETDKGAPPFVELDPSVCKFVKECGDKCVKEMFSRFVKEDGDLLALFPFQRLSHSFMIAGFGTSFDPQKEKNSNQNMRLSIEKLKGRVMEFANAADPEAMEKIEHYIRVLDEQLSVCDRTDEMIDSLG